MRMRMRMMMNDKRKREKIAIFDIICRIVEGGEEGANGTCYIFGRHQKRAREEMLSHLSLTFSCGDSVLDIFEYNALARSHSDGSICWDYFFSRSHVRCGNIAEVGETKKKEKKGTRYNRVLVVVCKGGGGIPMVYEQCSALQRSVRHFRPCLATRAPTNRQAAHCNRCSPGRGKHRREK